MNKFQWLAGCLLVLVALSGVAEVQMKDKDGKYRYHDPEVREEFLSIADALRSHQMYPKAEKLLKTLTKKWSVAGYEESLDQACRRLFYTLLKSGRLGDYEQVMMSCPASRIRQEFLNLAYTGDLVDLVFIYDLLHESWQAPEYQNDFIQICQSVKKQLGYKPGLEKYSRLPNDCSGLGRLTFRLDLARYFADSARPSDNLQAVRLYEQLFVKSGDKLMEVQRFEACAELTNLYLKLDTDIATLEQSCPASAIRKGQLLRFGVELVEAEDENKMAETFQKLAEPWTLAEQQDDLFRACQLLYWLLSAQGYEEEIKKYAESCPQREYTVSVSDPGRSPLMMGYLVELTARPIKRTQPRYPQRALDKGIEGYAIVEFTINERGEVVNPVVIESQDSKGRSTSVFNKESVKAAQRMKYRPKTVDGVPVEVKGRRYQFVYELEKTRPRSR